MREKRRNSVTRACVNGSCGGGGVFLWPSLRFGRLAACGAGSSLAPAKGPFERPHRLQNEPRARWIALAILFLWVFVPDSVWAEFEDADRIRIREAVCIAEQMGDDLWPGWSDAPFAVLLVTSGTEYLVNHPRPSDDFAREGYDTLLASAVWSRERVFDKNLLATFPAVSGIPTVVIGQPRNTAASRSTRWVATLLHEHFHQWQQSRPDYYSAAASLGLAGDDSTGMWMLDYPFPYDSPEVNEAFSELCESLHDAVKAIGRGETDEKRAAYRDAKRRFKKLLSRDDYAYFSFQLWQEGIARYTEYTMMKKAGAAYTPTPEYKNIPDYVPFNEDASETFKHLLTELSRLSLEDARRTAFYHVGAAEGILLDAANPNWRTRYLTEMFSTDTYFDSGKN